MKIRTVTLVFIAGLLFAVVVAAYGYATRPHDFNACLLKHLQGVGAQNAAALIYNACKAKFPDNATR